MANAPVHQDLVVMIVQSLCVADFLTVTIELQEEMIRHNVIAKKVGGASIATSARPMMPAML